MKEQGSVSVNVVEVSYSFLGFPFCFSVKRVFFPCSIRERKFKVEHLNRHKIFYVYGTYPL